MKANQRTQAVIALSAQTAAATATVAGTIVDMKDCDYATIILATSVAANTNAAPVVVKIQESDTTTTTDFTDISTSTMAEMRSFTSTTTAHENVTCVCSRHLARTRRTASSHWLRLQS
jgi:hypothetical protein